MSAPDYPLTAAMLEALLEVTRIDTKVRDALHDVLVMKMTPSAAAALRGLHRQHLHVQLKHIREDVKPAFDRYTTLALAVGSGP